MVGLSQAAPTVWTLWSSPGHGSGRQRGRERASRADRPQRTSVTQVHGLSTAPCCQGQLSPMPRLSDGPHVAG